MLTLLSIAVLFSSQAKMIVILRAGSFSSPNAVGEGRGGVCPEYDYPPDF